MHNKTCIIVQKRKHLCTNIKLHYLACILHSALCISINENCDLKFCALFMAMKFIMTNCAVVNHFEPILHNFGPFASLLGASSVSINVIIYQKWYILLYKKAIFYYIKKECIDLSGWDLWVAWQPGGQTVVHCDNGGHIWHGRADCDKEEGHPSSCRKGDTQMWWIFVNKAFLKIMYYGYCSGSVAG